MAGNSGGMFGAPIGDLAYQENYRDNLLTGIKGQEMLGQIAMQPFQARKLAAEADRAEIELQQNKQFAAMMAQKMGGSTTTAKDGSPLSLSNQMDSLAKMAMSAGMLDKGTKLAATAATIRSREDAAAASRVRAQQGLLTIDKDNANFLGRVFGGAKTQEEWNHANALFSFVTRRPSPMQNVPFSEELVKEINDQAQTTHERLTLEDKRLQREETKRKDDAAIEDKRLAREIRQQNTDIRRQREERLARAGGGKAVTSPNKMETDRARSIIKKDFPDLADEDVGDAASTVASEARALRRSNPALNMDQALAQALLAARQAGDFQAEAGGTFSKDKTRYLGRGKTPETAAIVPMDGKKVDTAKLVKGRFYVGIGGKIAKWNGKTMEMQGGTRGLSGDNNRGGEGGGGGEPDDNEPDDDFDDEEE